MVEANKDAFLGGRFERHDEIYDENRACVRYTMHSGEFSMEVTEWFYLGNEKIKEIISNYNVSDVSYEKNFSSPE